MGGLGAMTGLLVGGALTEYLSWRWVLFVNVPIGIAVLIGTTVLVGGDSGRGRVDLPGAVTATLGLGSLVYAINRAGAAGWSDEGTIAFLILSAVLLATFVLSQRRSHAPMVPPEVLRDRSRIGINVFVCLRGAGMLSTFYFLTLYMQLVKGFPPMLTGLAYLPFAVGIGAAAAVIGPRLLTRISERALIVLGMLLAIAGMATLSRLTPESNSFALLLPGLLVTGTGLGLAYVATTIVGVRGVDPRDTGIAAGLLNTNQQLGGAVGLAVLAGIAVAVSRGQPAGTPPEAALTNGYTAGILAGCVSYLVALAVAALTIQAERPIRAAAPVGSQPPS
jgi:predicted MFS family arabinose efflux permease